LPRPVANPARLATEAAYARSARRLPSCARNPENPGFAIRYRGQTGDHRPVHTDLAAKPMTVGRPAVCLHLSSHQVMMSMAGRDLLFLSHGYPGEVGRRPALRGFRNRRDAHTAAGPDLGGLVVLTAQTRDGTVRGRMLVVWEEQVSVQMAADATPPRVGVEVRLLPSGRVSVLASSRRSPANESGLKRWGLER
jgi:hypothetical protein